MSQSKPWNLSPEEPALCQQAMNKRYFSIEEADAMVPQLSRAFERILRLHSEVRRVFEDLSVLGYDPIDENFEIEVPGAPPIALRKRAQLRALLDTLADEVEAMQERGCLVHDLETGSIHWPARQRGREIYLCWTYGDPRVLGWQDAIYDDTARPIAELTTDAPTRR
ncbi:MAG: DUF2203 domain-containing protein [Deltaproteobacteria bacterium]|nr:DUF2203 domain-containing protein [Deltaproteobacteria bacterium]